METLGLPITSHICRRRYQAGIGAVHGAWTEPMVPGHPFRKRAARVVVEAMIGGFGSDCAAARIRHPGVIEAWYNGLSDPAGKTRCTRLITVATMYAN